MNSNDNCDAILTDQKLHDLLKAENEIDRLTESRRIIPCDPEFLSDEASQSLIS